MYDSRYGCNYATYIDVIVIYGIIYQVNVAYLTLFALPGQEDLFRHVARTNGFILAKV